MKRIASVVASVFLIAGCASLPASVRDRPLFESFDPKGSWTIESSDAPGEGLRLDFSTEGKNPQAFRIRGGKRSGFALIEGDTLYAVFTDDRESANVLRVFVAKPTPIGYEAVFGQRRLSYMEGRQHHGSKPFEGSFTALTFWDDGDSSTYKHHDIQQRDGIYTASWISPGSQVYGFGFMPNEERLVMARYTKSVQKGGASFAMGSVIRTEATYTEQWKKGLLTVAAYRLVDGALVGEILAETPEGVVRGKERLVRQK